MDLNKNHYQVLLSAIFSGRLMISLETVSFVGVYVMMDEMDCGVVLLAYVVIDNLCHMLSLYYCKVHWALC